MRNRRNILLLAMMAAMTTGCATSMSNQHIASSVDAPRGYAFGYQAMDMHNGSKVTAQVFDDGQKTYFIFPRGTDAERAYSPEHQRVKLQRQGPYWVAEAISRSWFVPKASGGVLCVRKGNVSMDDCEATLNQPEPKAAPRQPASVVVARAVTDTGHPVVVTYKNDPVMTTPESVAEDVAVYHAPVETTRPVRVTVGDQPRLQKAAYAPLQPGEGARIAKQSRNAEVERLRKQLAFLEQYMLELSKKLEMFNEI